jgi:hypothetical protein
MMRSKDARRRRLSGTAKLDLIERAPGDVHMMMVIPGARPAAISPSLA